MKPSLLCLLLSTPALAALPPLSASFGYAAEVITTRDYDFVDGNDHLPMLRVGVAYSLAVSRGILDVELQFHTGDTRELVHQAINADLWLRGVEGGAAWRYPLLRHLEPYARIGAGYDWATLQLAGPRLEQTAGAPAASALAGVQLPLWLSSGAERSSAIVLDLGIGYTLRPSFAFDAAMPRPPDEPGEAPIENVPTNLGSLSLSGISYRLLVSYRL